MKIEIENGFLKVSMCDMLATMTGDHRRELIDTLACESDVIEAVCDQIIEGYTSWGSSCGSRTFSFHHTPYAALDRAKRRIAESRDAIASEELAQAEKATKKLSEENSKYQQEAWEAKRRNEELSSVIRRAIAALEAKVGDKSAPMVSDAVWILREVR